MAQRKIGQTETGELGVHCPRCDQFVVPVYLHLLDYWNCSECEQSLDPSSLKNYLKAIDVMVEQAEREEYSQ